MNIGSAEETNNYVPIEKNKSIPMDRLIGIISILDVQIYPISS